MNAADMWLCGQGPTGETESSGEMVRDEFLGLAMAGPAGRGGGQDLQVPGCGLLQGSLSCSRGFRLNEPGPHRSSRTVSLLRVTSAWTAVTSVGHVARSTDRCSARVGRTWGSWAGGGPPLHLPPELPGIQLLLSLVPSRLPWALPVTDPAASFTSGSVLAHRHSDVWGQPHTTVRALGAGRPVTPSPPAPQGRRPPTESGGRRAELRGGSRGRGGSCLSVVSREASGRVQSAF